MSRCDSGAGPEVFSGSKADCVSAALHVLSRCDCELGSKGYGLEMRSLQL